MNRTLAHFFSILGHPLLVLTYSLLLLLALNPYAFSVRSWTDKPAMLLLISVFTTSFVLPGFGVALLKPLGLVKSLALADKQERIGPYILSGVFYLWLYKNLASGGQAPALYTTFVLGATIGLFFAFFVNIFTKISAHAVGMGGLIGMLLMTGSVWGNTVFNLPMFGGAVQLSLNVVTAFVVILAGLVGTARLSLEALTPADLYQGYAAGFVAMLLAGIIG